MSHERSELEKEMENQLEKKSHDPSLHPLRHRTSKVPLILMFDRIEYKLSHL